MYNLPQVSRHTSLEFVSYHFGGHKDYKVACSLQCHRCQPEAKIKECALNLVLKEMRLGIQGGMTVDRTHITPLQDDKQPN